MKPWPWMLVALAGPAVGLAIELRPKDSPLVTPMPFVWDASASRKNAVKRAADTNTAPPLVLPTRERFLQFATRPLFPKLPFGPRDRVNCGTPGLARDYYDGQWIVSTPVGLGMSEQEAQAWLATTPDTFLANLHLFEFSYRAMLVPRELDGPGFTFQEARQTAHRLTLAGEKWARPKAVPADKPSEPAWMASLRVPVEGGRVGASVSPPPYDAYGPPGFFGARHHGRSCSGHGHQGRPHGSR